MTFKLNALYKNWFYPNAVWRCTIVEEHTLAEPTIVMVDVTEPMHTMTTDMNEDCFCEFDSFPVPGEYFRHKLWWWKVIRISCVCGGRIVASKKNADIFVVKAADFLSKYRRINLRGL